MSYPVKEMLCFIDAEEVTLHRAVCKVTNELQKLKREVNELFAAITLMSKVQPPMPLPYRESQWELSYEKEHELRSLSKSLKSLEYMAHHLAVSRRRNDPAVTNRFGRDGTNILAMVATLFPNIYMGGLMNDLHKNTSRSEEMIAIDIDNLIPSSTDGGTLTLAGARLAADPLIDFVRTGTALRHVMIVASDTCTSRHWKNITDLHEQMQREVIAAQVLTTLVLRAAAEHGGIEHLEICHCHFVPSELLACVSSLRLKKLRLVIDNNGLCFYSDDERRDFALAISLATELECLHLKMHNDWLAMSILDNLRNNSVLQELELDLIRPAWHEEIRALRRFLLSNHVVQRLTLHGIYFNSDTMPLLIDGLLKKTGSCLVSHLTFGRCRFKEDALHLLFAELAKRPRRMRLQELSLPRLYRSSCVALAKCLAKLTSLRTLVIVDVPADAARDVLRSLCACGNLTKLFIGGFDSPLPQAFCKRNQWFAQLLGNSAESSGVVVELEDEGIGAQPLDPTLFQAAKQVPGMKLQVVLQCLLMFKDTAGFREKELPAATE
jgi:hypothetical protein